MERHIIKRVQGYPTQDGAGVRLVRVLGQETVSDFDPFLMLDSFDSQNPEDYTAGFPMHPHRGIETISFLSKGAMTHHDSMGFTDTVGDGEVQYMTAGSGILHEEQIPAVPRQLGLQLWLNLPARDKMADPAYHAIKNDEIQTISVDGGYVRLLMGEYEGRKGHLSRHLPLDYYDIHLQAGASLTLKTDAERSVMAFTLLGAAVMAGEAVPEKTAVKFSEGDTVTISAAAVDAEIMFMSSQAVHEPVFWGGPVVMDTKDGLYQAFDELRSGTFLKKGMNQD